MQSTPAESNSNFIVLLKKGIPFWSFFAGTLLAKTQKQEHTYRQKSNFLAQLIIITWSNKK